LRARRAVRGKDPGQALRWEGGAALGSALHHGVWLLPEVIVPRRSEARRFGKAKFIPSAYVAGMDRIVEYRGGARPGAGRPRKSGEQVTPKGTWIYVIHEVRNPSLCKVGLTTTNPRSWLSGMQALNPRPLKLAAVLRAPDRDKAWEIDGALKERLAPFHDAGFWFAAEPDRIVSESHKAAAACGSTLVQEPASDHAPGTRGGARPGAGRPKKPMPREAAPAS
jgi:hypothetical protein